jgi:hypothetical protein
MIANRLIFESGVQDIDGLLLINIGIYHTSNLKDRPLGAITKTMPPMEIYALLDVVVLNVLGYGFKQTLIPSGKA